MQDDAIKIIQTELKISEKQIRSVLSLLEEGNTVPFIARYRKEMTGSLDEDQIRVIEKEYKYQTNVIKRKEEITRLIEERGMLTDDIVKAIAAATKLQTLEDIYLPFKEKRKTKATEAIKMGFEPLAKYIRTYPKQNGAIEKKAKEFLTDDINTVEGAIEQAGFIIAEQISENSKHRDFLRRSFNQHGVFETKVKRKGQELDEKQKYEMYYDFAQAVKKMPSYRILAANRAEKEKILNVKISVDDERLVEQMAKFEVRKYDNDANKYIVEFVKDAYKRLMVPTIERETRKMLTEQADAHAISLFADNLNALITEPPLKDKIVLGLDPAFRTGCKIAVLDQTGAVKHIDVIYPTAPRNDIQGSEKKLLQLFKQFKYNQIVIGNGTASRETDQFVKNFIKKNELDIPVTIVSEAGASVYSASKIAQDEFPDLSVEQRSAVSIARRIQDPMAELVKIDPKAIGVGQYQHDVNQKELAENLDFVMIKNINALGVNVNTASKELLQYISGLDKTTAKNIVEYRNENGSFKKRSELKKVKRLGAKAFEQAAGFLKIPEGTEPLDATFIHPESYKVAYQIIDLLEIDVKKLGTEETIKQIDSNVDKLKALELEFVTQNDILVALKAPSFDFREKLSVAKFDADITSIEDVKPGMELSGQVRNIVDFGAFVDVGLKNDALIHISQVSNTFVKNVADVLKIGDVKTFKVKEVDLKKGRIQLTLREQ